MFRRLSSSVSAFAICLTVIACGESTTATKTSTWTVKGSAAAAPSALSASKFEAFALATATTGSPSSLTLGAYAIYVGESADCSGLRLVQDYGAQAQPKDFVQNPILFSGSPTAGSYKCVAIKMSDVIRMKPATSFGPCVAGTEYAGDIYRAGSTDFKDVNGGTVIGTGSDASPADDRVTLFLSRDRAAAVARGLSPHQTLQLTADLVVPGQSTFYWNAEGSVTDEGGQCGINPGVPSFR